MANMQEGMGYIGLILRAASGRIWKKFILLLWVAKTMPRMNGWKAKKADAEEQAVFEAHADGLLKKDDQRPVNGKNIAKRTMPRSTTAIVPKPIPWDERLNIISMKA